jgi:alkanesulfonate monooxygenase SsuD/methylene tetrahydromethanopterin reductase-like flavin-dependent oxidoreductase (luciferase family)
MDIGVVLPQVAADWPQVLEASEHAEAAGADSVWVIDHVLGFPADRGILEAWTVMSAVAARTERVEIGAQVLCQSFRNPALLAKMAATLDRVARGRLRMLVGAGWFQGEYEAFGWDFPAAGVRVGELRDTIRILKGLLNSQEPFSYEGEYYRVTNAVGRPMPVRQPFAIEVGAAGDRMLRIIAKEADGWNCPGALLPRLEERLGYLAKACADAGRSIDDLRLSCQIVCAVGDDDAAKHPGLMMFNPQLGLVGSIDQATARLGELLELGLTGFNCVLPPGSKGRACLERLLGDVAPQLGRG